MDTKKIALWALCASFVHSKHCLITNHLYGSLEIWCNSFELTRTMFSIVVSSARMKHLVNHN